MTCNEDNDTDAGISSTTQAMSTDTAEDKSSLPKKEETPKNHGTLILDATCATQNIRYPQYMSLLDECRVNLEVMLNQMVRQGIPSSNASHILQNCKT